MVNSKISELKKRQAQILCEIAKIDSMKKGTISKQFIKTNRKSGDVVINGPYHVLTKKLPGGKTSTTSIPTDKLPLFEEEIKRGKAFISLVDEYSDLAEQVAGVRLSATGDLAHGTSDAAKKTERLETQGLGIIERGGVGNGNSHRWRKHRHQYCGTNPAPRRHE